MIRSPWPDCLALLPGPSRPGPGSALHLSAHTPPSAPAAPSPWPPALPTAFPSTPAPVCPQGAPLQSSQPSSGVALIPPTPKETHPVLWYLLSAYVITVQTSTLPTQLPSVAPALSVPGTVRPKPAAAPSPEGAHGAPQCAVSRGAAQSWLTTGRPSSSSHIPVAPGQSLGPVPHPCSVSSCCIKSRLRLNTWISRTL